MVFGFRPESRSPSTGFPKFRGTLAIAIDHFGAICAWFPGILDPCEDLVHLFQQYNFHRSVRVR